MSLRTICPQALSSVLRHIRGVPFHAHTITEISTRGSKGHAAITDMNARRRQAAPKKIDILNRGSRPRAPQARLCKEGDCHKSLALCPEGSMDVACAESEVWKLSSVEETDQWSKSMEELDDDELDRLIPRTPIGLPPALTGYERSIVVHVPIWVNEDAAVEVSGQQAVGKQSASVDSQQAVIELSVDSQQAVSERSVSSQQAVSERSVDSQQAVSERSERSVGSQQAVSE